MLLRWAFEFKVLPPGIHAGSRCVLYDGTNMYAVLEVRNRMVYMLLATQRFTGSWIPRLLYDESDSTSGFGMRKGSLSA